LVFEAPDQVLFFVFKKGSVEPPKLPERELHNWTELELQQKKKVCPERELHRAQLLHVDMNT